MSLPVDDFKTVTFRVDRGSRAASADHSELLHYGDVLKLVFSGVKGIDIATVTVGLFAQTAGTSANLGSFGSFAFVTGSLDTVYVTATLSSVALKALVDAAVPGNPVTLRLYLRDSIKTWLDQDVDVYPCPLASATPAVPTDCYVTAGQLNAIATTLATMSTLTAAEREARMNYLIAQLGAL